MLIIVKIYALFGKIYKEENKILTAHISENVLEIRRKNAFFGK